MIKDQVGCKACFLPHSFTGISFDEDGVCNFCHLARDERAEHAASAVLDLDSLRVLGARIREESHQTASSYDAIIGASGGIDSTYVIYLAKRQMGLNPLVVKYRNGFGHPLADQNLTVACDRLGVDLVIVPPIAAERQYLYHSIKALRNLGVFFSSCFSCHFTIAAVAYRLAQEHSIRFMLTSTNPYENQLSVTSHGFMLRQLWSAFRKAEMKSKLRFVIGEVKAQAALARLKFSFDGLSLRWLKNLTRLHPVTLSSLQKVNVSHYVPWDIKAIETLLRSELGWQSPRDGEVPYMRFDCHVINLVDYTFLRTAGVSEHGILTNYLVQNGVVSKEAAKETFDHFSDVGPLVDAANEVLAELGVEPLRCPG